jgi:peptide/nickel transport system substrate-binding protein
MYKRSALIAAAVPLCVLMAGCGGSPGAPGAPGGKSGLPSAWVPYLSGPFPPRGQNLGGNNKEYESLVAKAQGMTPPAACAYWQQAEQAAYRDLDIVPISDRRWSFFLNHAKAESAGYEQPVPTSIRVLR